MKPITQITRFLFLPLALCLALVAGSVQAQIAFTAGALTQTQNFDGMAATTLPNGYTLSHTRNNGANATAVDFTAGSLSSNSTGGTYKYTSGSDYSVGFLFSSSFGASGGEYITAKFVNNTGGVITGFSIAFDYKKYRSGSRQWDWTFFGSTDNNTYTAISAGNQTYAADAGNTTTYFPPQVINKTGITVSGLNIANGAFYYLRWKLTGSGGVTNGQALSIDNLNITACMKPLITTAISNAPLCQGSTLQLTSAATGTSGITYAWTGPNSFTSPSQNPSISNAGATEAGSYQLTATNTCGSSNAVVSVVINLPSVAPATLNASVLSVCNDGSSAILTQNGGSLGTGAYWQWYTDAGYTQAIGGHLNSSNASLSVSPSANTTYYLQAEATAGPCAGLAAGPAGGITISVTQPAVVNAGGDQSVCAGDLPFTLGNASVSNEQSFSWSSSGTGFFTPNNNTLHAVYHPSNSDISHGSVLLTLGAIGFGPCGSTQNTMTLTIHTNPVAVAQATNPICTGSSLSLTGSPNGMSNYQWSGPNGFNSSSQSLLLSAAASASFNGVYQLSVTDGFGCSNTATTTIGVLPNTLSVSAAATAFDCPNNTATVTLITSGGTAPFQLSAGPVFNGSLGLPAQGSGTHVYPITDANGCMASASITLNGITPSTGVLTDNAMICQGDHFTSSISAISGNLISWQSTNTPENTSSWVTVSTGGSNYNSAPLFANTYYRVVASTPGCISAVSNTVEAMLSAAPATLTAGAVSDVNVRLSNPQDPSWPLYLISWSGGSAVSTLPYDLNGLTPGTNYTVTATPEPNPCGVPPASVNFTTTCPAPSAVSSAALNSTHEQLSWTSSGNGDTLYYHNLSTNGWHRIHPTTNPFVLPVNAGSIYECYLQTNCAPGVQTRGPLSSFTTQGAGSCSVPVMTGLVAYCATKAQAVWTPIAGVNSYKIYICRTSAPMFITSTTVTGSSCVFNTIPGATYQVYVKVNCGSSGLSSPSNVLALQTPDLLPAPDNLVVSQVGCGGFTISWSPVAGATQYVVRYMVGGEIYSTTLPAIPTSWSIWNPGGSPYQFSVASGTSCTPLSTLSFGNFSPWTNAQGLICKDYQDEAPASDVPDMILAPNPNQGTFSLAWTATVDGKALYTISNLAGQILQRVEETVQAGPVLHQFQQDLSNGIYLVSLETASGRITRKMVVTH